MKINMNTVVTLKPMQIEYLQITIEGISPVITHPFGEKAKAEMREKHAGKKTKNREKRDPEAEFKQNIYTTEDGRPGVKVEAFKGSFAAAAHKDLGISKVMVKKAIFIQCEDSGIVPFSKYDEPIMREDTVRVGMGSSDLRYRPEFRNWAVDLTLEVDTELLQAQDVVNLIDRAGFGVGIHEWRPERSGVFGRFRVAV